MRRLLRLGLPAFLVLVLFFSGWIFLRDRFGPPPSGSIAVCGGERLEIMPPETIPHFRQADPRWAQFAIGGSGESIGAVGCTLCCVSMAFEHFGIASDPAALNEALIGNQGYTEQGWIRWNAVESASGDRVRVTVHQGPSHEVIDRNLRSGQLTLAKFFLPLGIPHWVLICGKDGDDYLIQDPAVRDARPIRFSTRAGSIVSIRTLSVR